MNKLIRTVLLVILITGGSYFTGISQALYPVSLDEKVDNSTLIVEGKVKGKSSFWNTAHTMIYTSNIIEVYKIFKGSLIADTIEVMTQGGSVGDYTVEVSDLLQLYKGDIGIFFCYPNQINLRSPKSRQQLWDVYSSAQGCYKYNLFEGSATAPFANYKDVQNQVYPQLEQKTRRQPQIINKSFKPFLQQSFRVAAPPVTISGFSPATVKAGSFAEASENVLTINGSNFGTATGSAGINFDNPDDGTGGTPFFVAATSDLIVSWADGQVVVKVPGKVGTGTFSVVEAGGTSGNSPTALQVKYAIINGTFGSSPIYRQYNLMDINGSGGYNLVYSTSTAGSGVDFSTSSHKPAFERALTTWNEVAGLNFTNAGTTTSQSVSGDGVNIIMLDNANTTVPIIGAGVLAVTYSWGSSCAGTQYIRRSGFDMIIRNPGVSTGTYNFNFGPCKTSTSSTEYDLETTLLHELGHALNLGHINDSYIGSTLPNIDPGKLMHYASVNGTDRRSPDWSSFTGAQYCINPRGLSYGGCTGQTEMIPLTPIVESKDECPITFPSSATSDNTLIAFDLNHATSNKTGDPQATTVNCAGTVTAITNNVYYAIKTNSTGGILTVAISGYTTTPSTQQACAGAGIELVLYQTSSCPAAQSFPSPVACRTFNADGVLSNFTGLAANTNYLVMVDGISNTKATFNLLINGSALPLKIASFTGIALSGYNTINWKAENNISVDRIVLESSIDGINFTDLYGKDISAGTSTIEDNYNDYSIIAAKYYRLKMFTKTGSIEYSNIILLKQIIHHMDVLISPNPVKNYVNVSFYKGVAGPVTFNLLDVTGKLLNSEKIMSATGEQTMHLSIVKGFSKGNYILQINTGEATTSHKILVQ
ncbi:MAG: type sorting protein [Chitinophagaceae bacterium]|nr:type sorting protein [Chitinophagaceae bacterium]